MENDEPTVRDLVARATAGDAAAWESIVTRFTPLVVSVAGRYRLREADVADVAQAMWLQLVQHLPGLREPAALPGWIATTTRNECLRVVKSGNRATPFDPQEPSKVVGLLDRAAADPGVDDRLLDMERHEALLAAFAELSDRQRELLLLLLRDPPLGYREISDRTGMPIGAIGPTRARAVARLRGNPKIAALFPSMDLRDEADARGRATFEARG